MKTIIISSDHNGVEDKQQLKTYLKGEGYRVIDIGPYTPEVSVDYVDYAAQLSTIVGNKEADRGILLCGTGVGMSIVANRFAGVRAVLAHNELTAVKSREHNDSNVLCLGSWLSSQVGFLGRQLFWNKEKEEALILVNWESKKLWKSIPMSEVNLVQEKFEKDVKNVLNIGDNPFELIYEGELDKQVLDKQERI